MTLKRNVRTNSGVIDRHEELPALSVGNNSMTSARSRSRHRTKTPLPAIRLKQSTAYGTNNSVQPLKASGPQVGTHLSSVLHNILQPHQNESKPRSQSHCDSISPTIKTQGSNKTTPDRSFEIEDKIFQCAGVESSITDPDEISPYHKDLSCRPSNSPDFSYPQVHDSGTKNSTEIKSKEHDQLGDRHHQCDLNRLNFIESTPHRDLRLLTRSWRNFRQIAYLLCSWLLSCKKMLLFGIILFTLLTASCLTSSNMQPISHYLSEISPNVKIDELNITNRRLSKLESDISLIQKKVNSIDFRAIKKLEEILPQSIVLKRRNGKFEISEDVWQAIYDKIRLDDLSVHGEEKISFRQDDRVYGSNNDRYRRIWYQFLSENDNKLGQLSDKNFTSHFPQILHENGILSRAEIIDIIQENWDKNSAPIHHELKSLALEFKRTSRNHEVQLHRLYSQESGRHESGFGESLANAHLRATAQVNIKNSIIDGKMRTNHFSRWTGAFHSEKNTSPNYVFPSQAKIGNIQRLFRSMTSNPVPSPKGPEEALTKWEEQGDCWCSPQKGTGFGPSLGVILGNKIYPEEIVVEHVPSYLALQPGAAPRNLELFAKIEDPDVKSKIWQESRRIFPDLSPEPIAGLEEYARVAAWIYELDASSNIQTHEIPLSLKAFDVDTDEVVVRIMTNWGRGNVDYTCIYRVRLFGTISQPHPDL